MAAHIEEFVSRGQKYQTCLILSSRPREANFSLQFPRTREETAEQTALRASFLSSFLKCAAGFNDWGCWCSVFERFVLFSLNQTEGAFLRQKSHVCICDGPSFTCCWFILIPSIDKHITGQSFLSEK